MTAFGYPVFIANSFPLITAKKLPHYLVPSNIKLLKQKNKKILLLLFIFSFLTESMLAYFASLFVWYILLLSI